MQSVMDGLPETRKLIDVIRGLEHHNKRLEAKIGELEHNHRLQMEQKEEEYSERSHEIMERTRLKFEQTNVLKQERSLMQQQISAISDQLAVSENQAAVTREVATKYKKECQGLQDKMAAMQQEMIAASEQQVSAHEEDLLRVTHQSNIRVRELQEQHKQVLANFELQNPTSDLKRREQQLQKTLMAERKKLEEYQTGVHDAFQEAKDKNSAIVLAMKLKHTSTVDSILANHGKEIEALHSKLSAEHASDMQRAVIDHQLEVRELKASLRRDGRAHLLKSEEERHSSAEALSAKDQQHAEDLRAATEDLRREHQETILKAESGHQEALHKVESGHQAVVKQLGDECRGLTSKMAELKSKFDKDHAEFMDSHRRTISAQESAAAEQKRRHKEAQENTRQQHEKTVDDQYKAHEGVLISLAAEHSRQIEELEMTIERQAATIEALSNGEQDPSAVEDETDTLTPSRLFDGDGAGDGSRLSLSSPAETKAQNETGLSSYQIFFLLFNIVTAAIVVQKYLSGSVAIL